MTGAGAAPQRSRSLQHLEARLGVLEARVRAAVGQRRSTDAQPEDRFRGLYLSDAKVDELLEPRDRPLDVSVDDGSTAAVEVQADAWELAGEPLRLRSLARSFGLDELDLELLVVALAPDLDARFEQLYGYLQDDVTRRRRASGWPWSSQGCRRRMPRRGRGCRVMGAWFGMA